MFSYKSNLIANGAVFAYPYFVLMNVLISLSSTIASPTNTCAGKDGAFWIVF
tara:strand:+ start:121 stop:276 length:156 start_codon:yes stop_codon:yes gene_type:complete